jgi:V/A-type H+-transporting ATPase subunit K
MIEATGGFYFHYHKEIEMFRIIFSRKWLATIGMASLNLVILISVSYILMPEAQALEASGALGQSQHWGYLAAAISIGTACIAAGFAVAHVGSAAVAAISEKPESTGRMLVLVGLAEGIAIYGLIVSIMILDSM